MWVGPSCRCPEDVKEMSLGFRVVKIRDSGPLLKRDSKNLRSFEFRV